VAQQLAPNLFDLKGDGVTVSYSTSSLDGRPRFNYKKGRTELNFAGDEIKVVKSGIGDLVTVTIAKTVDRGFTTFSILLPDIALTTASTRQAMRTFGITTLHKTSISGPVNGVQETYKVISMRGSAKLVKFLSKSAGTSA